jgi:hypothetical protein
MASAWVLPSSDDSQLEEDVPRVLDLQKGHPERHQSVLGLVCIVYLGCFVVCLIAFISFLHVRNHAAQEFWAQ